MHVGDIRAYGPVRSLGNPVNREEQVREKTGIGRCALRPLRQSLWIIQQAAHERTAQ